MASMNRIKLAPTLESIETDMPESLYGSNLRLPQLMSVDLWDAQYIFQGLKGPSCYTMSDIMKLSSEIILLEPHYYCMPI